MASAFRKFYDLLSNMGLIVRDDPKKVVQLEGRVWGVPVDDLRLSIQDIPLEEKGQLPAISVVLHNHGTESRALEIPGWMFFYEVDGTGPDGSGITLSHYGKELLKPSRKTQPVPMTLAPGAATETDFPLGTLCEMRARGNYRVAVSCQVGGGRIRSNEVVITV